MANHPNRFPAHASCGANFAAAVVKAHLVEEESNPAIALRMTSTVKTNRKDATTKIKFIIADAFAITFDADERRETMVCVISKAFYEFEKQS